MAADRLNIFPSRANLVIMKQRIVAATRGLNLLKRKRDALELKLRELTAELDAAKEVVDKVMAKALFSMAKANFLDTDLRTCELLEIEKANIYMRIKNTKVAGLLLPQFDLHVNQSGSFPLTGLSRGGEQVEVVRARFQDAVRTLVSLASLEYAVHVLKEGVHQNNMRVNALEYVMLPRYSNTVAYIRDELDEYEREDFYRLKRSQAKQRRAKEKFAEIVRKKNMTAEQLELFEQGQKEHKSSIVNSVVPEDFNINTFLPPRPSRIDTIPEENEEQ